MAAPPPDDRDEDLDPDVREAITGDIARVAVPMLSTLLVLMGAAAIALGQPRRAIPNALYLVCLVAAWWLMRKGRTQAAGGALGLGAVLSATFGMLWNGGLRAPALLPLVATVALVGWVGGPRSSTRAALAASAVIIGVGLLAQLGLLPDPPLAPQVMTALIALFAVWLIWASTSSPQARLRQALRESVQREAARSTEEQRRLESELAFKAVFEQAGQLMLLLEPGGQLVRANRAAHEFFSGSRQLVEGAPPVDTVGWPEAARERLRAALVEVTEKQAPLNLALAAGNKRTLDVTLSPFRDQAGKLRYVIVQGRDITALLEEKEREARAGRLALVGQLAGGVAHDFNNVLAVTLSCAETLQHDLEARGQLTADDLQNLETITSVTERAADLTRRLLTFGRRAPLEKKVRSMHELLTSTVQLLKRTLPPNVNLQVRLGAKDDLVEADAATVESVLINLAINARDAMPGGGSLVLSTDRVELDEAACKASGFELKPGAYLRVDVTDTGTGIAPEVLPRVFEPFFTTKAEGKGSGIGLASVLGAMQDHHGAVQVDSAPGRGSTFSLLFPLASQAAQPKVAAPAGPSFAGLKVLVVDDEPALRSLMARITRRLGLEAVIHADAADGLAAFEAAPASFDLAILDVVLPGRSGHQLAVDLLARSPRLKVLLVSGFTRDADVGSLPRDRAALLPKPFTVESLRAALGRLLSDKSER